MAAIAGAPKGAIGPAVIRLERATAGRKGRLDGNNLPLKMLLGGASNSISSLVCGPMDVIKTRQQLFVKSSSAMPTNFATILTDMVRMEGPTALWKGLSAALIRDLSYSGIRLGGYDIFKGWAGKLAPKGKEECFGVKVAAGIGSGVVGAAIANPADLIKIRMQATKSSEALSFIGHWRAITASSGIAGLYRAVLPTAIRAGIVTSSQLATYDETKRWLLRRFAGTLEEGVQTSLFAAGFAGLVTTVTSAPVDTIKVRLMNDSTQRYDGALDCVRKTVTNEGPLALYKGFAMSWMRLWPQSVIALVAFEQLRSWAGLKPI